MKKFGRIKKNKQLTLCTLTLYNYCTHMLSRNYLPRMAGQVAFLSLAGSLYSQSISKPNVLFIAVDDLKPVIGCYGDDMVHTPNIDRLAGQGAIFMNTYCQQAVSGPTRASLMTGMRPDYTQVWDLKTRMRDINPDILTIPQYFAAHDYTTSGIGKIFDFRCIDEVFDEPSWTIPFYSDIDEKYYPEEFGEPVLYYYQDSAVKARASVLLSEAAELGLKGHAAVEYAWKELRFSTENMDVPDNAYKDGAAILQAMDLITALASKDEPFFFAFGFEKPHLPFIAPSKYWNMYNRDSMPVAPFQEHAKNSPEFAYHNSGELRAYSDIPPIIEFNDLRNGIRLPVEKQRELIHGYYAATSYVDAQLGKLLNLMDSLNLTENTIIILWGDHGWHLGDHDLWCKHTNFEQAAHVPLIISAPGLDPIQINQPTEFIDIFPTLCELAGLDIPEHLHGESLAPLMSGGRENEKDYSISQYPRGKDMMGYSLRTADHRLVWWLKNGYRSNHQFSEDLIVAKELYDYIKDPLETVNLAGKRKYSKTKVEMEELMIEYLKSQENKY